MEFRIFIRTLQVVCLIGLGCIVPTLGEVVLGVENEEFDFDGLPGAQHEFKINIGGGMEECLYQNIVAGGKLHVSYEVIDGGDRLISASIRDLRNSMLQYEYYKDGGTLEIDAPSTGAYAICLDNSFSRFTSKLVYIYIVTYVQSDWSRYVQELETVHLTVANFSASVREVEGSLQEALKHQASSRMHVVKDWYLILGNNKYIQNFSIAQCAIILCTSLFQVFFVRRLFKTPIYTPTAKPRA